MSKVRTQGPQRTGGEVMDEKKLDAENRGGQYDLLPNRTAIAIPIDESGRFWLSEALCDVVAAWDKLTFEEMAKLDPAERERMRMWYSHTARKIWRYVPDEVSEEEAPVLQQHAIERLELLQQIEEQGDH